LTDKPKTMLLIGATSDIGLAVARAYAAAGWRVLVVARDPAAAARNAGDIATRSGAPAAVFALDVTAPGTFAAFAAALPVLPDTIVCVAGLLGDQARAEAEPDHAAAILRTNFEGPALLLDLFARHFAARGSGTLVGVSSVAGDRGRASNYFYGSAKAGFSAYLSGLRNRLAGVKVRVVTVKPGFVRTRMTKGLKLPNLLTAEPAEVGRAIYRAAEVSHHDVIYVRPVWRLVMAIICAIPEPIFKRLRL
jgi:NAD(P)-dependent dehydrogenase (short-subunit alcohol dehydrogenase family)